MNKLSLINTDKIRFTESGHIHEMLIDGEWTKNCLRCGGIYNRPKNYTNRQWRNHKYCSKNCAYPNGSSNHYFIHGHSHDKTYRSWKGMKERCLKRNCKSFKNYGGRGIKVCKRWMNFKNFLEDMGEKPKGMTIDRINNDGNYEPGNCRWTTPLQQSINRRNVILYKFKHRLMPVTLIARELKIKIPTFRARVKLWGIEKAIEGLQ